MKFFRVSWLDDTLHTDIRADAYSSNEKRIDFFKDGQCIGYIDPSNVLKIDEVDDGYHPEVTC